MISFKGLLIAFVILTITVGIGNASHQRSEAPTSASIALRINEFMADNKGTLEVPAGSGNYPDWIELYNSGTFPVDLNGLYLTDDLSNLTRFQINQTLVLGPQEFVLFYADGTGEGVHTNFGLSRDGETIALVDIDGTTILDSYTFGPQEPDISEGRSPDGTDTWRFFDTPTPGSSNPQSVPPMISNTSHQPAIPTASESVTVRTTIIDDRAVSFATLYYGTGGGFTPTAMTGIGDNQYEAMIPAFPDQSPVRYYVMAQDDEGLESVDPASPELYGYTVGYTPPPLYVNEFMANNQSALIDPAESNEFPDWFEIYNAGETALDLNGYYLTDDLTDLTQYQITDTLVIQPQGFLLFYADNDAEQGIEHTNFGLNNEGDTLVLVDKDGFMIIDSYTFGLQSPDLSEGRLPDGSQKWLKFSRSTPNESNSLGLALSHEIFLPLMSRE